MTIDSSRFQDFGTRQIIKAAVAREERRTRDIPWAPMTKPPVNCTVALLSTAGVARNDDTPFDQDCDRRNPWCGDPGCRAIPLYTTEADVTLRAWILQVAFAAVFSWPCLRSGREAE